MEPSILDVGCGNKARGTVNCDLYVKDVYKHRSDGTDVLVTKGIPNFVCCDARFLPFKTDCFDIVFSGQVIEHFTEPLKFLCELSRVCKVGGVVNVETVHRFGERIYGQVVGGSKWFQSHHVSHFNIRWFVKAAPHVNCKVVSSYTLSYACFPHDYFAVFRFPYEFGVKLVKAEKTVK